MKSIKKSDYEKHLLLNDEKHQILEQHGYIIQNQILGVGAFSTVMRGFSVNQRREVAIKVIPKVIGAKDFLVKFLPRELDIMRELVHPNVITFYQALETNVKIYLVIELVIGGTLLQVVNYKLRLNEENASNIFFQLCNGMEYCHRKGVAHRDLKCENVLVDLNGNVKIIDFGFGRNNLLPVDTKFPRSTTFCGSYAYASPEILQGKAYVPQLADVWSLGVILYIMLFGHLPFEDTSLRKLIKLILSGPTFRPDIPLSPEAEKLIRRILVREELRCHVADIKEMQWVKSADVVANRVSLENVDLDKL